MCFIEFDLKKYLKMFKEFNFEQAFIFTIIVSFCAVTPLFAQSLTDVSPITVTANGQVIENVRISAVNEPANW
jgi:hypothetical protein